MDSSPRLRREASVACSQPFDVGCWCGSRRITARFERMQPDDEYDDEYCSRPFGGRATSKSPAGTRLRRLWRRIMKEKRKIVSPVQAAPFAYDPYTYAQNFDEGAAWAEPENLSRSFSARFAVPSRVLQRLA
ncbi:hypothetical protein Cni_G22907 [Canna indica]|uniref:Uncharacterized protein n=1 Tax=Canna indica TaxID=4628 RepID=A0AAQ3KS45_9LILI|nr:hypothetical protein Cni_G22907 [Canna indica]